MNKNPAQHFLAYLLQDLAVISSKQDVPITGLTQDSRLVKPGYLFFACPGSQQDGRAFIQSALEKGAAAIAVEAAGPAELAALAQETTVPIITIPNLSHQIGNIAARFYEHPSKHLKIIGITGTNGKTSCCHFIAQALHLGGHNCGIIGTLGNGIYGQLQASGLTTPDAISLQKLLAEFRDQGIKYVAMEVSSHALDQGRVQGINFSLAVFTNLSRDHLDYHGDLEHYAAAKRLLFAQPGIQHAILNIDDSYGQQWLQELNGDLPVIAYSLHPHSPTMNGVPKVFVHHAQFDSTGITASIHTPWGDGVLHNSRLVGQFNLSNLLAVITVLGILKIAFEDIIAWVAQLTGVPGRMETFGGSEQPLVVVDFAHTPDALEKALLTLNTYKQGKLWCVFGCGGDRDRGKRPLMGRIAEQYADQIVITDDNPRHEDAKLITAEILQGLNFPEKAVIEHDRRRAIAHAVSCAQVGDVVLVAGKGHETYQITGDEKEPFNDALEVQKILVE